MALTAQWHAADMDLVITNGDDEPADWGSVLPGAKLDEALTNLGYERVGDWRADDKGVTCRVRIIDQSLTPAPAT